MQKKNLKFSLSLILVTLFVSSCELLTTVDYSGTYSGNTTTTLTVAGIPVSEPSTYTLYITKTDGVYYNEGYALDGSGSSYTSTVNDGGIPITMTFEFTSTSVDWGLSYSQDLAGVTYFYESSGTLDKQ